MKQKKSGDHVLNPIDWALLVVATGQSQATTPVQLQKILFLADRNLSKPQRKVDEFYAFDAYDYGPFSKEIYADMQRLAQDGLVQIDTAPGRSFKTYRPTELGIVKSRSLMGQLEPGVAQYITQLSTWARSLSFNALVSFVYQRYPEMKENSVFQS
jgi:uncharacterized protein YwgA